MITVIQCKLSVTLKLHSCKNDSSSVVVSIVVVAILDPSRAEMFLDLSHSQSLLTVYGNYVVRLGIFISALSSGAN